MRLLFYGLQNSGATLLTLLAGQRPDSLVIPDLFTMFCAPQMSTSADVCLKATITTFPLAQHLAAFQPDHTFLVIRRPVDNIASLRRKVFARHDGTPEQKFAIADQAFEHRDQFTDVLVFEDAVADPSALLRTLARCGWDLPANATEFPRHALDMERRIWADSPEVYASVQWGTGEARVEPMRTIRLGQVHDDEAADFSRTHAPRLHAFYEQRSSTSRTGLPLRRTVQDDLALQGSTTYARQLLGIVSSLLRLEQPHEALELATEVCGIAPHYPAALDARAQALERCGRVEEAIRVLEVAAASAAEDSPENLDLQVSLTYQALRTARVSRAEELAIALVKAHPEHAPGQLVRAKVAQHRGHLEVAQEHAELTLTAEPRNVQAHLTLADALAGQGHRDDAVEALELCLAIAPEFPAARQRLARLLDSPASAD